MLIVYIPRARERWLKTRVNIIDEAFSAEQRFMG
jgi:hypothetical protein